MSAIVRTQTPFIHRDILLKALDRIGEPCEELPNGSIRTSRTDFYGVQTFQKIGHRYVLWHDSSADNNRFRPIYPWGNLKNSPWMLVSDFLKAVERAYKDILIEEAERLQKIEQELLVAEEEERLRREAEDREAARVAYIQVQEQTIIERAKAEGYHIVRKEVGGKIRLTLSRTR